MEREDGEMSDDNEMLVDAKEPSLAPERDRVVLYKADKNCIVVRQLEKVDASKLEERAKRFGLNLTGNRLITQRQIDELYVNFGIESGNERHFRFDAIHLNGVEGLTTKEIFQYLEEYKPLSLDWIDDTSCNIVCQDHISAALALLVHSREIKNEDLKSMLAERSSHHWREGMPHPKKDLILIRFATNGDKKMVKKKSETKHFDEYTDQKLDSVGKNPWGDLCKSWGVYDHQEIFNRKLPKNNYEDEIEEPSKIVQIKNKKLAMRLGKRRLDDDDYKPGNSDDSNSDSEWKKKSKTPRMRMRADDEESRQMKKPTLESTKDVITDVYPPLSIEVLNSRSNFIKREATKLSDKFNYHNVNKQKHNILSRLGDKILPAEDQSSDESLTENSECNIMSKVQKVNGKLRGSSSVWSRLEMVSSSLSDQCDLRQMLKSKTLQRKPNDLRERIGKSKQSHLRIEIDNNNVSE